MIIRNLPRLSVIALLSIAVAVEQSQAETPQASPGSQFPYEAYISTNDLYVRAGPGKNYYPTSKLQKGNKVEVYRHDPGGWYAIRPPKGSFTWVSGRYLDLVNQELAIVTADRVQARVGCDMSDVRDVVQVRLVRGQKVKLLDSKQFGYNESSMWYKISPPPGEFRWVSGQYVDRNYLTSGVRDTTGDDRPAVSLAQSDSPSVSMTAQPARTYGVIGSGVSAGSTGPAASAGSEVSQAAAVSDAVDSATSETVRTADHWSPVGAGDSSEQTAPGLNGLGAIRSGATGSGTANSNAASFGAANSGAANSGAANSGAANFGAANFGAGESPSTLTHLEKRLSDLRLELSLMLTEEPTVWYFDEMELEARDLLNQTETAVERGQVRLVLDSIQRSQQIKLKYEELGELEVETERTNRQLELMSQQSLLRRPKENPYDASGRLVRIQGTRLGQPPYALVDTQNRQTCFVKPAPGVNLEPYINRNVGFFGSRATYGTDDFRLIYVKQVVWLNNGIAPSR